MCFWSTAGLQSEGRFGFALLLPNVSTSVKSPGFWSPQYICTCFHYSWCTPSGGDRGRCGVAFSLDRAPESGKRGERDNLTLSILQQLTSGAVFKLLWIRDGCGVSRTNCCPLQSDVWLWLAGSLWRRSIASAVISSFSKAAANLPGAW